MSKERKKLEPPTHLEPTYLYHKYEPLRKAVLKKFKDKMSNQADREDLMSTIDQIFFQLVSEYDPNRGVDFPYYIKRMLDLRTYHHVDKFLKRVNKEHLLSVREDTDDDPAIEIQDESIESIFERIVDLNSISPDLELGQKHSDLMIGVLIHRKTLKELADEEGVPVDRLHARLYFLLKKLRKQYDEDVEWYGEDLY
jgi:RNA polymerase sigma factor (sigma-70 family)